MTVVAPPRPPAEPVDPEALIEEARRHARRRRQLYAAGIFVAIAGAAVAATKGSSVDADRAASVAAGRQALAAAQEPVITFIRGTPNRPGWGAYVVNADGSGERRLTRESGVFTPAWAPDGSKIAFEGGLGRQPDIYVVDLETAAQRRLTESPRADFAPSWSTDGDSIAFAAEPARAGKAEIFTMDADGGAKRNLTRNPANDHSPVWLRDGRIAFLRESRGFNSDLYVMNADGSAQHLVARLVGGRAVWSPNGEQVALVRRRGLYVLTLDGGEPRRLTSGFDPAWSPDGSRVAFASDRGGNRELYLINADGTDERKLTRNPAGDRAPAWSPDGSRIAFVRSTRGEQTDIYVMNADGSAERRVTSSPLFDWAPTWSPGRKR